MNEPPKMVESYGDAPRQRMSPMGLGCVKTLWRAIATA
jgi:hypothetical protein